MVCTLSTKRMQLLRATPALLRDLRKAIRAGEVPRSLDLGELNRERQERIMDRLREHGPTAWSAFGEIIRGEAGTVLRRDARILDPGYLARLVGTLTLKPTKPAPSRSVERLVDELRLLVEQAHAASEHLLVIGYSVQDRNTAAERMRHVETRYQEHRAALAEERRIARGMSRLDERIIHVCLHSNSGFNHPNPSERCVFFWDLADRLIGPGEVLRLPAVEEIRVLLLLWASGGAATGARRLAALMLARVAGALGNGGDAAQPGMEALSASIRELGEFTFEIMDETDPLARTAIALACARIQFQEPKVLQRVAEKNLRGLIEDAYAGQQEAYDNVLNRITPAILDMEKASDPTL